jgi:hypothetical protein
MENCQRFEAKYRIVLQGRITWKSLKCINMHRLRLSYHFCADTNLSYKYIVKNPKMSNKFRTDTILIFAISSA